MTSIGVWESKAPTDSTWCHVERLQGDSDYDLFSFSFAILLARIGENSIDADKKTSNQQSQGFADPFVKTESPRALVRAVPEQRPAPISPKHVYEQYLV